MAGCWTETHGIHTSKSAGHALYIKKILYNYVVAMYIIITITSFMVLHCHQIVCIMALQVLGITIAAFGGT